MMSNLKQKQTLENIALQVIEYCVSLQYKNYNIFVGRYSDGDYYVAILFRFEDNPKFINLFATTYQTDNLSTVLEYPGNRFRSAKDSGKVCPINRVTPDWLVDQIFDLRYLNQESI